MNSRIKTFLKLAFVVVFLYFLAQKGFISLEKTKQALGHWEYIGPSLGVYAVSTLLGILRWQILLRAHGIELSFWRTSQLNLIGQFFNVALPGAVSGDFVKAFYIGRESAGKRADAFGSILFDRVTGLSALVVLCAIAMGVGYSDYRGSELFHVIGAFMGLAAATVVGFFTYLFLVREHHDPFLRFLKAIESRFAKASSVKRVYLGLRHYHNHRAAVLATLAISLLIHSIIGWACLNFAHALGDQHLPLVALYIVVPLGLLVTAVPVAPGGIGTGHAAFGLFFQLIGSKSGADVFSLVALTNFLIGAIGGIIYLIFKSKVPGISEIPASAQDSLGPVADEA